MGWGGATIGWAYSGSVYEKHSLSGSNSARIGCRYYSTNRVLIYKLNYGITQSLRVIGGEITWGKMK